MDTIEKGQEVPTIGKIKGVPLREVWKHEALDFTTWVQENLDVLNDTILCRYPPFSYAHFSHNSFVIHCRLPQ